MKKKYEQVNEVISKLKNYWQQSRSWTAVYGCLLMTIITGFEAITLHEKHGFQSGMLFGVNSMGTVLWFSYFVTAIYDLYLKGRADGSKFMLELNMKRMDTLNEKMRTAVEQSHSLTERLPQDAAHRN